MKALVARLQKTYLASIILIGVAWVLDLPQLFGLSLISAEWIGPLLSVGIAAAFLRHPYGREAGWLELALGIAALGSWTWMSAHYHQWVIDISGYTPDKYLPGIVAILLLMEAMRKSAGLSITILIWILLAYGLLGFLLPQPLQAEAIPTPGFVMYLYSDTNGVPGLVMTVVGTLVLAFIVLGKLMEVTGATTFFTEIALATMGHRRGGPAKVAVLASSVFGSINGTAIGNIMSTGIVTIPLMKRSGFQPHVAGAIEAVASNGGQLVPPVMGATAFLIAEFLQVSYAEVVLAALVPALLYYVCLFVQVDAIALRQGLHGLPKSELPQAARAMKTGWIFLLPLALLVYLLFWRGFDPGLAAMASAGALLVVSSVFRRRLPSRTQWLDILVGGGANMLPLLLIGGGAGVVIGVMNITGLGFSLSIALTHVGENAGVFVMLLLCGGISIVLGMGMPTTALYVVLSVILAPALVEMGVSPMAAHLFIFYFGLLSFLTPPVAIASFVAAGLAESNMWSTAWEGMKLGALAYVLPFLWCYNEALILDGSTTAIVFVLTTTIIATLLVAQSMQTARWGHARSLLRGLALCAAGVGIGSSTIWLGPESIMTLLAALGGVLLLVAARIVRWRDQPMPARVARW